MSIIKIIKTGGRVEGLPTACLPAGRRAWTGRRPRTGPVFFSKAILLLLIFVLLPFQKVHAQQSTQILRVSPAILNIILSPGKTYTYKITVQNLLAVSLPLHTGLDDLSPSDDDTTSAREVSPLLSWIALNPTDMIIPPHESREIALTLKLPAKIPLGGYYGDVLLEPVLPASSETTSAVAAKIGVIILANIGVPRASAENGKILDFKFDHLLYEKGPVEARFGIKNVSLYHFSAKPFIRIKPLFGPEETKSLVEKIVLPGKTRRWHENIDLTTPYGLFYRTVLAVSVGGGEQIVATSYFLVLPWKAIMVIAFIMALIIIVVKKRKNLNRSLSVLFGKK